MNHIKRKHYRVATKKIHPTPAEGIYVPKAEMRRFCLYASSLIFIATIRKVKAMSKETFGAKKSGAPYHEWELKKAKD